ncbi:MAG TPA: NDP-hexose 2,3-dehydratase family protein [Amycolatopsis sp.]|uniref:NDP-hexose 2,3-dehydratase family protein n=1 Tax=Amycolatopsis sp. TaxID=37632 RepID=UPI002B484CB3|nr:NDP-hexose 2,3-dehydratase family protein [Amycolatopsis sp.]HKS50125.1 NDP-hexose 2,3-dehydratase family protein [Amycolatopsis sp.]
MGNAGSALQPPDVDDEISHRIARSAQTTQGTVVSTDGFASWFTRCVDRVNQRVRRIPFGELREWRFAAETGNLVHDSGRFFSVEGLTAVSDYGPVPAWTQPIINQPEIGILGILVKEFDGVLHCLMQAKAEPGNVGDVQLSPTVQATKSNYSRVHGGRAVPYLDFFRNPPPARVMADVLQSEQGSWFFRKRNRNMIVEADGDIEVGEDFCWLTIGQVNALLTHDNLVNMDARTVLSCFPLAGRGLRDLDGAASTPWGDATYQSLSGTLGSAHATGEIGSWITGSQSRHEIHTRLIPLREVTGWHRSRHEIAHELGVFFRVIAVDVEVAGREVRRWAQPLLHPHEEGIVAFLAKRIDGVLHVLVNARVEPGYLDIVELAPTVQCTPGNYRHLRRADRPLFLDLVLGAKAEEIRFDTVLSEEGGRFYRARSRYLVVEVDDEAIPAEPPDYRWMTLYQLSGLLRHSHYVNVQARTLIACLRSAWK